MKKPLQIEWSDIPLSCEQMAIRRTADMVSHFGNNIRSMRIETLAASCYLQGVEDWFRFQEKKAQEQYLDFSI